MAAKEALVTEKMVAAKKARAKEWRDAQKASKELVVHDSWGPERVDALD